MKISESQLRVLRALHEYFRKNDNLPSLKNLLEEAGMNGGSTTAVVKHLNALERAGVIGRSSDKERRPFVTAEGHAALGIVGTLSLGPDPKLHQRLSELGEELAEMYEAAWDAMLGDGKRKAATVAHHIRDIGYRLADYQSGDARVSKYLHLADPDGRKTPDFSMSVHNQLPRLTHKMSEIAHGKEKIDEAGLLGLMKRYEEVLTVMLSQQGRVFAVLDRILKDEPSTDALQQLVDNLSLNPSARIYFFNHIPSNWAKFILQQKNVPFAFFQATLELGDLVIRIAKEDGTLAADLTLRVEASEHDHINASFAADVFKVLEYIPAPRTDALMSALLPFLEKDHGGFRYYPLVEALKKPLISNNANIRNHLFQAIVAHCVKHLEEDNGYHHDGISLGEAAQVLRDSSDVESVALLFLESLDVLSQSRFRGGYNSAFRVFSLDGSHDDDYDRGAIETFVPIVMSQLDRLFVIDLSDTDFISLYDRIFGKRWGSDLLLRVKLHCLRKRPQIMVERVHEELVAACWNEDVIKEWGELLEVSLGLFSVEQKASLLQVMNDAPAHKDEERRKLRIAERFVWIRDAIDTEEIPDEIKGIIRSEHLFPEPTVITSWHGPESPKSLEELKSMDATALVNFLHHWEPKKKGVLWGPSYDGLARILQQLVQSDPKHPALLLGGASLDLLEPVYIEHIFRGYEELLKNKKEIPVDDVIRAIAWFADRSQTGALREPKEQGEDRFDSNTWRDAHRAAGHLVQTLLQSDTLLSDEQLKAVRSLCEFQIADKDPGRTRELEFVENGDELSLPLNAVRGIGLTAHISLFLYEKRNKGLKEPTLRFKAQILDAARSGSICDAVVIGRHLPWLYYSDETWFAEVWTAIEQANEAVQHAAWVGFLVSRLDPKVFDFLHRWYRRSFEKQLRANSSVGEKKRQRVDLAKVLPEHLVYAVAYDYPHARELMDLVMCAQKKDGFKSTLRNKMLADFVSFFGRVFVHGENHKGGVKDLQYLQETIREIISRPGSSSAARSAFGWCVSSDTFPVDWLLSSVEFVLGATQGSIQASHRVVVFLREQAVTHPKEVLRCLILMFSGKNRDRWFVSSHKEDIHAVLDYAKKFGDDNAEVRKLQEEARDLLLKQGFMDFRD